MCSQSVRRMSCGAANAAFRAGSSSAFAVMRRRYRAHMSTELSSHLPGFEIASAASRPRRLEGGGRTEIVRRRATVVRRSLISILPVGIDTGRLWSRISSCAATRTIDAVFYSTRDRPGLSSLPLDACPRWDT